MSCCAGRFVSRIAGGPLLQTSDTCDLSPVICLSRRPSSQQTGAPCCDSRASGRGCGGPPTRRRQHPPGSCHVAGPSDASSCGAETASGGRQLRPSLCQLHQSGANTSWCHCTSPSELRYGFHSFAEFGALPASVARSCAVLEL